MELHEIKTWVQYCGFAIKNIWNIDEYYSESELADTMMEVRDSRDRMMKYIPPLIVDGCVYPNGNIDTYECVQYVLCSIETLILQSNKDDRAPLISGLVGNWEGYCCNGDDYPLSVLKIPVCKKDRAVITDTYNAANSFMHLLAFMCSRYNIAAPIWANGIEKPITALATSPYVFPRQENKYKTIPRTHRIAAVKELMGKCGLFSHIDKTKIAKFIEAVTGGNITTKAKDTVSYKEPTADAKQAAAELLKKIGIE